MLVERTGADELMLAGTVYDPATRQDTLARIAKAWGLPKSGALPGVAAAQDGGMAWHTHGRRRRVPGGRGRLPALAAGGAHGAAVARRHAAASAACTLSAPGDPVFGWCDATGPGATAPAADAAAPDACSPGSAAERGRRPWLARRPLAGSIVAGRAVRRLRRRWQRPHRRRRDASRPPPAVPPRRADAARPPGRRGRPDRPASDDRDAADRLDGRLPPGASARTRSDVGGVRSTTSCRTAACMLWEDDGGPVSMAGRTRPGRAWSGCSAVYTPPERAAAATPARPPRRSPGRRWTRAPPMWCSSPTWTIRPATPSISGSATARSRTEHGGVPRMSRATVLSVNLAVPEHAARPRTSASPASTSAGRPPGRGARARARRRPACTAAWSATRSSTSSTTAATTRRSTRTPARTTTGGSSELGRSLPGGIFGENLTTDGVDVNGAVIGEIWRIGDVVAADDVRPDPVRHVPVEDGRAALGEEVRPGQPHRRIPARGDPRARSGPATRSRSCTARPTA